jgi:predicted nucleotidyltransferase
MKKLSDFLRESIIDPERYVHSVAIFDLGEKPVLKSAVRNQILAGISRLSQHMAVKDYTLIGSILTTRYAEDSDVDVNVLVSARDEQMDELVQISNQYSGKFVEGTKHPINYHILNDESDFKNANDSADAVFDISSNSFLKLPAEKPFYLHKYMDAFKSVVSKLELLKNEMRDDLIDYRELRHLSTEQASLLHKEIESELKQIEKSAVGLVNLYDTVKKNRADAFARDLTVKDIHEYGAKNSLPENVLYKLLERHHYLTFLHKVKEIIGDDKKLSSQEANQLDGLVSY